MRRESGRSEGARVTFAGMMAGVMVAATLAVAGCGASATAGGGSQSTPAAPPIELNVSAAATLKALLTSTAPAFEKAHNAKLVFNFGASGTLLKQIEGGAPVDVFLSASRSQIASAVAEGLISAEASSTFASNSLVILVASGNPSAIAGPADLSKATKLTTGDPAIVPAGTKSKEWLVGRGLWDSLKPRFVFAQNSAQLDDYVARKEVDAGIGFGSDAHGRADLEIAYTVPTNEFKPIAYVGAPIKAAKNPDLAKTYMEYLLAADFQSALVSAGFEPAPSK